MARFLLTLLCVFTLGQALALAAVSPPEECAVTCVDDSAEGTCEPICSDCGCCSHGAQPLLAVRAAAPCSEPALETVPVAERTRVPAADPRDVFHVPLSLLA